MKYIPKIRRPEWKKESFHAPENVHKNGYFWYARTLTRTRTRITDHGLIMDD